MKGERQGLLAVGWHPRGMSVRNRRANWRQPHDHTDCSGFLSLEGPEEAHAPAARYCQTEYTLMQKHSRDDTGDFINMKDSRHQKTKQSSIFMLSGSLMELQAEIDKFSTTLHDFNIYHSMTDTTRRPKKKSVKINKIQIQLNNLTY